MSAKRLQRMSAAALFEAWRKDAAYRAAYDALEDEFAIAAALIKARAGAGLTQSELAERVGTTQSAIARLESGKAKPSTTTLERIALATKTRLRVTFEPLKARKREKPASRSRA